VAGEMYGIEVFVRDVYYNQPRNPIGENFPSDRPN